MIRVLTRPPGAEEFGPLAPEDVDGIGDTDLVWVDVSGDDLARIDDLLDELGMAPPPAVPDNSTLHAGIAESDNAIFLTLPTFGVDPDGGLDPRTYRMVIGETTLVTIHSQPIGAIDRQWESTDTGPIGSIAIVELASMVSSIVSRQVLPLIEELEQRIDGLEELAFASDPRTLTEVHALRRDVITLRRIVSRQRDIMDDLAIEVHPAIGSTGQEAFRRAFDHDTRLVDVLDSARSLLQSVLETYRGAVADQTNEIVRLLTVFSAILLPLGLIAGIFGMNFTELPASEKVWGFWVTIGAMALLALGLWSFFARRGFIGGPRLKDLPRAVGLGIFTVGSAPVKVIATGVGSTIQQLDRLRGRDPAGAGQEPQGGEGEDGAGHDPT